ncbi:hypothetical protein [Halorubrum sp. DTA46]|uniref:hypothetical protein n=1 Tax=Halorubrum sp. DTA46 TaxID=3402162 RepID=UPI003AAE22DF
MIKSILVFLILYILSRIAGLVGKIGSILPAHKVYTWLFNKLLGIKEAREWRDDHVEKVSEIIADSDKEIENTPEELVSEIDESRNRVESVFSDGESVLSLAIAIASFTAPPLVAVALAIVLIISVSVRQTAIRTLGYNNQDPNQKIELLRSKCVWNETILKSKMSRGVCFP